MNSPVIYRKIPATDPKLLEEAAQYGVSDLGEALGAVGGRIALMSPRMRAIDKDLQMIGVAVTAYNAPGDNLMMHVALQMAQQGQVLVVASGGCAQGALWGDLAGTVAQGKGLAGIVVDGGVRDVDALRRMRFPVFSTAISPAHTEKRGPGAVNVPMVCDGVLVHPGDIIAADGDGVIVIPRADFGQAVEGARARSIKENAFREKLRAGGSLFELTGLEKVLAATGIPAKDMTWEEDR